MFGIGNIIASAMLSSNAVVKSAGTAIHNNADKILLGTGVSLIVGGTVYAAVNSKKMANVVARHRAAVKKANEIEDQKDRGRAKLEVYKNTALETLMVYGPCVLLTGTGIACIMGSHHILTQRLASCQAAYAMLDTSFREYRERVRDKIGVAKENDLFNNTSEIDVWEDNGDGKKPKHTKVKDKKGPKHPCSFIFDEANPNWLKNGERNRDFLLQRQFWFNQTLSIQEEVSLADILFNLQMYESKKDIPANYFDLVWRKGSYISFGLEDNEDFMAGREPSVWLTFNPDGFRRKLNREEKAYLAASKECAA